MSRRQVRRLADSLAKSRARTGGPAEDETGAKAQAPAAGRRQKAGDIQDRHTGPPSRPAVPFVRKRRRPGAGAAWQRRLARRRLERLVRRGASRRRIIRYLQDYGHLLEEGPSQGGEKEQDRELRSFIQSCVPEALRQGTMLAFQPVHAEILARKNALRQDLCTLIVGRFVKTASAPYGQRFKPRVRSLALSAAQMRDLLISFPALLFALAGGYGTPARQEEARRKVLSGAPLKEAAEVLALPLWTRKLPAAAFKTRLGSLPGGARFSRQIGNYIPANEKDLPRWLGTLSLANAACDEDFALWLARFRLWIRRFGDSAQDLVVMLAAFAWYSRHPDTRAGRLIRRPWSPQMGVSTALARCKDWYEILLLEYYLGSGIRDAWLKEGTMGPQEGYEMVALRTPQDLVEEAEEMRSCVRDYGAQLGLNDCRLFSLRKYGRRVATVEIRPHPLSPDMLSIWQLRGPGNAECPDEIRTLVHNWLRCHSHSDLEVPGDLGEGDFHEERWQRLWLPYVLSRGTEMGTLLLIPDPKLPSRLFRLS